MSTPSSYDDLATQMREALVKSTLQADAHLPENIDRGALLQQTRLQMFMESAATTVMLLNIAGEGTEEHKAGFLDVMDTMYDVMNEISQIFPNYVKILEACRASDAAAVAAESASSTKN